jgi:hypothetical protein
MIYYVKGTMSPYFLAKTKRRFFLFLKRRQCVDFVFCEVKFHLIEFKNTVPSLFKRRQRVDFVFCEVKFYLSEFENTVPSLFKRRQRVDFVFCEVKFHLSEFENTVPSLFKRRQRVDFVLSNFTLVNLKTPSPHFLSEGNA